MDLFGIIDAHTKLSAAQDAAEESWNDLSDELTDAVDSLREEFEGSDA